MISGKDTFMPIQRNRFELVQCYYCGTPYDLQQVTRQQTLRCVCCGGSLDSNNDGVLDSSDFGYISEYDNNYFFDGGNIARSDPLTTGFWDLRDDPAHESSRKFMEKQMMYRQRKKHNLSDEDKAYIDSIYGNGFADEITRMPDEAFERIMGGTDGMEI